MTQRLTDGHYLYLEYTEARAALMRETIAWSLLIEWERVMWDLLAARTDYCPNDDALRRWPGPEED